MLTECYPVLPSGPGLAVGAISPATLTVGYDAQYTPSHGTGSTAMIEVLTGGPDASVTLSEADNHFQVAFSQLLK